MSKAREENKQKVTIKRLGMIFQFVLEIYVCSQK